MQKAILETAQRLFMQQGIRATTMDHIAEELGISKKTLYEHFASKDALVEKCAEAFLQDMEKKLDEIRQNHRKDIVLSMIATANYVYELLTSLNPVLFAELRRVLPHARAQIIPQIQEIVQRQLTLSLREGIQSGIFRSDLPLDFLPLWVSYIILLVVLNPSFAEQAKRSVAEIYAETILLLLYSFTTEKGRALLELYKTHIRKSYA